MDNEKLAVRGRDGSHDVLLICSPYSNCQHIGAEGSDTTGTSLCISPFRPVRSTVGRPRIGGSGDSTAAGLCA